MRLLSTRPRVLVSLLLLFAASLPLHAVDPTKNLAPRYRHWINEEVNYIIDSDERKEFLALTSDAERENFIKVFWDARNPTPGSDVNEYKEEHYRRLAYANQYFGNINAQDGWRTDRGHIYIVLGEPKQKANYPESRNVRPLQIWFYEAANPALPSYFYVMFYKRSIGEDYTLYSPYQDGPSRLVTGLEGKNDQKNNLDILKRSLGSEVARTAISLIPSEPVNLSDYSPSMQSDILLSTIKGLPDNPLTKEMLAHRRANERVTTSIFLGENAATLQPVVFRENNGGMTVHYLLSYGRPEQGIIGQLPDKRMGYSLTLQTSVLTKDGKFVYEQNEKLAGVTNESQTSAARSKRFGAESRVPLAPGEYQLVATLTNDLTHIAVRQRAEITVPDPAKATWGLSKVLIFSPQPPTRDPSEALPFSVSGIRFVPKGVQQTALHSGEPLRLLFQIWSKPSDPGSREGHKVKIHYAYGTMQAGLQTKQEDEDVDAANFSANGTLLTGHTLSTEGLSAGNYRLVITATDEATQQKAYTNLNFHVATDTETTDLWTAYEGIADPQRSHAIDDYKRGLSASMQGSLDDAVHWMQQSVNDDPGYTPAITRLVDLLAQSGRSKDLAALSGKVTMSHDLSQQTAIQLSQANAQIGDYPQAAKILEYEMQFQPPSSELYLALADVYRRQGNVAKAEDYKRQAAKLTN